MEGGSRWILIVAAIVVVVLIVLVIVWMCRASQGRKGGSGGSCMKPIDHHHQDKLNQIASSQSETVNLSRIYMMELAAGSDCSSNTLATLKKNYSTLYQAYLGQESKAILKMEMSKYDLYRQLADNASRLPHVKQQLASINQRQAELLTPQEGRSRSNLERILNALSAAYLDQLMFAQRKNCQLSMDAYEGATQAGELLGNWMLKHYGETNGLI